MLALPNLQLLPSVHLEEVAYLLVVDLEDGHVDSVRDFGCALARQLEELSQRPRIHPAIVWRAGHRERLARARLAEDLKRRQTQAQAHLSVGEHAHVVAVKHRDHERRDLFVHLFLGRAKVEHLSDDKMRECLARPRPA
jgi:uncharacterized NAD(P)/FAD-binding protein YdhS